MRPRRAWLVSALVATVGLILSGSQLPSEAEPFGRTPPSAAWSSSFPVATSHQEVTAQITIPAWTDRVVVRIDNGYAIDLPDECRRSSTRARRTYLDGAVLRCLPRGKTRRIDVTVLALGEVGSMLSGTVTVTRRGATRQIALPRRVITGGPATIRPHVRLVSSPDFLNADIADLRGHSRQAKGRKVNSTNPAYERVLARVIGDFERMSPDALLVAGDLVSGRWGSEDGDRQVFGPTTTLPEKRAALRRAARTYYPQWKDRLERVGLKVLPAVGDHEYGDDRWRPGGNKLKLIPSFRREFARAFTRDRRGRPRYADHPRGPARATAYAHRVREGGVVVQVVSLDVFHFRRSGVRFRLDPQQLRWVERVLRRAQRDGVDHIVVQGHTPILPGVRAIASSQLTYEGGADSKLWRLMEAYDVDLYLAGEAHNVDAREQGGVVQVVHGGVFSLGLTNALIADFYGDEIRLALRDYPIKVRRTGPGTNLWQTKRRGLRGGIRLTGTPYLIGAATVRDGRLVAPTGALAPNKLAGR